MRLRKAKAFTLTELLVVVIVLGVLATVAVPKFSRVLETRRTTEAENMLSAVRTEQEVRCTMGKPYLSPEQRNQVMTLAKAGVSGNYDYQLLNGGIEAHREGKYTLRMWYKTGEICCEGDGCADLNKNYPICSGSAPVDECASEESIPSVPCTGSSTESCGCNGGGTRSRTCDTSTGIWSDWGACSIPNECFCDGPTTQSCGCNNGGTQSRTCDTNTGIWSNWGSCSIPEDCDCPGSMPSGTGTTRSCNTCGQQTLSFICNTETWTWQGVWSDCSVGNESECEPEDPEDPDPECTGVKSKWDGTRCVCPGSYDYYVASTNACCSYMTPKVDGGGCWSKRRKWAWVSKNPVVQSGTVYDPMWISAQSCSEQSNWRYPPCASGVSAGVGCNEDAASDEVRGGSGTACTISCSFSSQGTEWTRTESILVCLKEGEEVWTQLWDPSTDRNY